MLEKGRLYSLRKDGTKDSVHLNIKNKRFLFGSSEHCTVRIYIDGIFPEHCILTVRGQEKAYLEPMHPSALILVNGVKIKHEVILEENDVITILGKKFQFTYPPKSLSINVCLERLLVLPDSKQLKSAQEFELSTLGKNWILSNPYSESGTSNINYIPKKEIRLVGTDILKEIPNYLLKFTHPEPLKSAQKFGLSTLGKSWITSNPCSESGISNLNYIPKKQICLVGSDLLKEIPNYLLKFTHQEPINILYEKINVLEVDFRSDKCIIKYMNQYVNESFESRRNLALKLYEFIIFLRELLNRNVEHINDLWLLLKSVWKFCNARANEDVLFLPLRSLNFNGEAIIQKKSLQSRISLCAPKNSSRKLTISYKKRVSLAVKRYNLRKRKSIMMAKSAESGSDENLELSGERVQLKDECRENNSEKQDVVLNFERQKPTRTKKKRGYNKNKKEELQEQESQIKQGINIEVVTDIIGKRNTNSEPAKEKQRKKKAAMKKTNHPEKENIAELTENSSQNQIPIPKLREQKQLKGKQSSKNRGMKESIHLDKEQISTTKPPEKTKRSYKKKKETVTNNNALSDEMETKFSYGSPMKQNNSSESNELKPKKVDYRKKKEMSLETTDSRKSNQEQETQELPRCQRITRSMVKSRH